MRQRNGINDGTAYPQGLVASLHNFFLFAFVFYYERGSLNHIAANRSTVTSDFGREEQVTCSRSFHPLYPRSIDPHLIDTLDFLSCLFEDRAHTRCKASFSCTTLPFEVHKPDGILSYDQVTAFTFWLWSQLRRHLPSLLRQRMRS